MIQGGPEIQAGAPRRRLAGNLTETFWGRAALRLVVLVLFLGAWQLAGDDSIDLLFPTATRTLDAFVELVRDGRLPLGLLITGQALAVGFAIIVSIGVPTGVLVARFPLADRVVTPYFTFLVAIPIIALVPVVQALLGLTFAARVTVIVLFGISYVVINSAIAVRRVRADLTEMARSFGAGRLAMMTEIVLPAALPGIMTGVRLALGQALIGMVVAELTIVGAGVGSLIAELQGRFKVAGVLAVAMTVVLVGLCLLSLVEMMERHVNRWSVQK